MASIPGLDTRPTPDRLRESLFNILAPRIEGAIFVDLYAGTGAVGIEALSRGAAKAIFVEHGRAALAVLRENIRTLGLTARADVRPGKVLAMIARVIDPATPSIVFADPPYELEQEYESLLEKLAAIFAGYAPADRAKSFLVIVQHSPKLNLKEEYGVLHRTRVVKQGSNALSFFEP